MAHRVIHLPWTQQPQGAVSPGLVFGRRLLFLVNAPTGPMDLVSGALPTVGDVPITAGPHGVAFEYGGETGYIYPLTMRAPDAPAVTVFALIKPTVGAGGNGGRVLQRSMGSATPSYSIGVHRGTQDGPLYMVNGTLADVIASPSANIGDSETESMRLLLLSVDGDSGTYSGYADGDLIASGSGIGAIDYSRSDQGLALLRSGTSSTSTFRGRVYYAGVIEGALTAAEARVFSGLESFEPRRVWVPVASAGGGGGFQVAWAANANTMIQGSLQ